VDADERGFYGRWVAANALAEAAGLGTTFVLGQAVAPTLAQSSGVAAIAGTALVAVLLGTLLEGVVVGVAQERVLRTRVRLETGAWTRATAAGAGAAWVLGMIPSTVLSLAAGDAPGSAVAGPGPLIQYGLAVLMGLVTGPILGIAQWVVLRRAVAPAGRWLWANAVAWAVGMPLIFLGMDFVPWDGAPAARVAAIYLVCAAAGLAVGAIHGRVLVAILRRPRRAGV
jgi:hypothetical protein